MRMCAENRAWGGKPWWTESETLLLRGPEDTGGRCEVSASTQVKRGQIQPVVSVGTPPSGLGTHRDAALAVALQKEASQTFQSLGRGRVRQRLNPIPSYFLEEKPRGQEKRGEQISQRGDRHSMNLKQKD